MKRLLIVGSDACIKSARRWSAGLHVSFHSDGRRGVRRAVRDARPDVVLVDGLSDARTAAERLCEVREEAPKALILLISTPLDDPTLHQTLEALTVVCAPAPRQDDLVERASDSTPAKPVVAAARTVRRSRRGNAPASTEDAAPPAARHERLTARESQILRAVAEGNTNAGIGRKLWVTEETVKFHLSNVYRKLRVSNRTEASHYALMHGLVALPAAPTHEPESEFGDELRTPHAVAQVA